MPTNVEIKAVCAHPERARQVDVYYVTVRGRLKLRQDGDGERLIYYQRPASPLPKISAVEILPVGPAERPVLDVIGRAVGVRARVEKRRAVYRTKAARLHLDCVEGLGDFVEIEVDVATAGDEDRARSLAVELMDRLGLAQADLVSYSYAELAAMKASSRTWRERLRGVGKPGALVLLDGASCSGKTTLVGRLLAAEDLAYVPRYCTRDPRPGEVDGKEYLFVGHERFLAMAAAGAFLEYRDFEFGMSYGLAWDESLAPPAAGRSALGVMNLGSVRHVKDVFPEAVTVLIDVPEETILERMVARGINKPHEIEERLANARRVESYRPYYDHVVSNQEGRLDQALAELRAIIRSRTA